MSNLNSKMTALADEVRELSGSTEALSIEAMTTNVDTANDEVNTQVNLIAQIKAALEGKAAGSGASGATWTIGTFTVTDNGMYEPGLNEYVLESNDLRLSERICVLITELNGMHIPLILFRNSLSDSFDIKRGSTSGNTQLSVDYITTTENSITIYGEILSGTAVGFRAI